MSEKLKTKFEHSERTCLAMWPSEGTKSFLALPRVESKSITNSTRTKNSPGTSRSKEKLRIPLSEFCLLKIKKLGTFLVFGGATRFFASTQTEIESERNLNFLSVFDLPFNCLGESLSDEKSPTKLNWRILIVFLCSTYDEGWCFDVEKLLQQI